MYATAYTAIRVWLACWLSLLLYVHTASAQQSFTLQDGNRNAKIECLTQHPNGYLLLGTVSGIHAFSGTGFTKYSIDTSIGTSHVTAIAALPNGKVWAGFSNGALAEVQHGSYRQLVFEEGKFNQAVTSIRADAQGRIWCGTAGEGVYCYDNKKWYNINTADGLSDDYVYELLMVKDAVLAATDGGVNLIRFTKGKKQIQAVGTRQGLADNITTHVAIAIDGRIVAGHQDNGYSILQLQPQGLRVLERSNRWTAGAVTGVQWLGNAFLIATADSGLLQLQPTATSFLPSGFQRNTGSIAHLLVDKDEHIWTAQQNNVQLHLDAHVRKMYDLPSADIQHLHAIHAAANGAIWYASHNQVIAVQQGQIKRYRIPTSGESSTITSLYLDAANVLWIGTMGNGIWLLDMATGNIQPLQGNNDLRNASVLSISGYKNDIWVSSLEGALHGSMQWAGDAQLPVYKLDMVGNIQTIGTNYIYDILQDSKGNVWFATDGKGVTMLSHGEYKHFTEKEGLNNDVVYTLAEDSKGRIWMNVMNGGLHFIEHNKVHAFNTSNGLSSDAVSLLKADEAGNIVAVTAEGIDLIDTRTMVVQHWGKAQGLPAINTDLNAIATYGRSSVLIAAGTALYSVSTTALHPPKTYFERITLFLNDIDSNSHNRFSSDENNFGFHFNAVDFTHAADMQFQYMLEGLSNKWMTTKDHYVNFPKLPPGNYVFRVRASVNGSFGLSPVAVYQFYIAKPLWQRWWFIVLASGLLAGLLWWLIRYRERQQQHVQQLQQAHLQSQLATLKSQVSPHFFFNSLNTLMALIEDDRKKQALDYTAHLSDFFRKIVQFRNEDTIPLRSELALVADYVFIQQQRFGNALQLDLSGDEAAINAAKIAPLTLQLLIENAIKHNSLTVANPLRIHIAVSTDWITVSNNLLPKIAAEKGEGMGLQNIEHRYQLLTGKHIDIVHSATHFTVSVPIPR